MGRSELAVAAPPEAVWEILAEPRHYGYWVVGSSAIRGWDSGWPKPGSRFYHRVGIGPLTLADHTEAVECDPPRLLVLSAKSRPLGAAKVEMTIDSHPAGSLVVMVENPDARFGKLLTPPPLDMLIRLRNAESLRRLRTLVERRFEAAHEKPRRVEPGTGELVRPRESRAAFS